MPRHRRTLTRISRTAALTVGLALLAVPAAAQITSDDLPADAPAVERVSGSDRFSSAARMAVEAFPAGSDSVVIARGDDFPDALAASYMARVEGAPILLTRSTSIPNVTLDTMATLDVTKVVLVGGVAAISSEVENRFVATYGRENVHRIDGSDRFQTAASVAQAGGGGVGALRDLSGESTRTLRTAIVAYGRDFPDAMSAGPLAYAGRLPVLLTNRDDLPIVSRFTLQDGTLDIQQVIVVGGTGAISDGVFDEIAALDTVEVTVRIAGDSRSGTAAMLAALTDDLLGWDATAVSLAVGSDFPDALALAPLAALREAPIVLAPNPDSLRTDTFLALVDRCSSLETIIVAGGTAAVTDATATQAQVAGHCATWSVTMTGDAETNPGDPDATGTAWFHDDSGCYAMVIEDLDPAASAAHIHEAPAGSSGAVTARLATPDRNGFVFDCLEDGDLEDDDTVADFLARVAADPTQFYVNVHNADFAAGAIRGQLG